MIKNSLHYLRVIFVVITVIALYFITLFPLSILVLPFDPGKRLKWTSPCWKLLAIYLFWAIDSEIYNEDKRPEELKSKNNPSGLYISNHQSLMDIPLILTSFQSAPIMKKSLLYIPFFGISAYSAGAIPVDRKSLLSRKETLNKAIFRLHNYSNGLQYYPEGSRNKEANSPKPVNRIKTPLMAHAYDNNIPVYSISIYNNNDLFHKRKFLNFGKVIGLYISEASLPKDFPSKESFIKHCWNKVEKNYSYLEDKLNSETI